MLRFVAPIALFLLGVMAIHAQGTTTGGKTRHARNLPELVVSFAFTFDGILTEQEKAVVNYRDPSGMRETHPELYEKMSQNVQRWTEDWIEYATEKLETVPEERVERAQQSAEEIDGILTDYFAKRDWPYRKLRVVFLPQRLLYNQRNRGMKMLGVFIPCYPDVFFSTVDPFAPLELILVHESLHYNADNGRYGTPLLEGITDVGARHLVVKYDLLSRTKLRNTKTSVRDRTLVELICSRLAEINGITEEKALETMVEAYLTGDDSRLAQAFGEQTWDAVVELSWTRKWRKSDLMKLLDQSLQSRRPTSDEELSVLPHLADNPTDPPYPRLDSLQLQTPETDL